MDAHPISQTVLISYLSLDLELYLTRHRPQRTFASSSPERCRHQPSPKASRLCQPSLPPMTYSYSLHSTRLMNDAWSVSYEQIIPNGGKATGTLLETLKVVGDVHDESTGEQGLERNNGYIPPYEEGTSSRSRLKMRLQELHISAPTFSTLDKNYLTPFFSSQNEDEEDPDRLSLHLAKEQANPQSYIGCLKKGPVFTNPKLVEACRFYIIESAIALGLAFLINVSIISLSGTVCSSPNLNPEDKMNCDDLDLNKASFLLTNVLGKWSSKLFGIALLASGQSFTITGTYAGQYVMQIGA